MTYWQRLFISQILPYKLDFGTLVVCLPSTELVFWPAIKFKYVTEIEKRVSRDNRSIYWRPEGWPTMMDTSVHDDYFSGYFIISVLVLAVMPKYLRNYLTEKVWLLHGHLLRGSSHSWPITWPPCSPDLTPVQSFMQICEDVLAVVRYKFEQTRKHDCWSYHTWRVSSHDKRYNLYAMLVKSQLTATLKS